MRRFTTPRILVRIDGADLTGCDVYVTLWQGANAITIKNPPMAINGTVAVAEVRLTQEQSARFRADLSVLAQVNVVDSNNYRAATDIAGTMPERNLLEVSMTYGE